MGDVTLSAEDAHFLAVRLRRLCAHLNYTLPPLAKDDAVLINIAGTVIGALLTNMTYGKQDRECMTAMVDAAMQEMRTIQPPLGRSACERLIAAALSVQEKRNG